jgi:hypothetical protein
VADSVGAGRRVIAGTVLGLSGTLLLAGVGVLVATLPLLAPS